MNFSTVHPHPRRRRITIATLLIFSIAVACGGNAIARQKGAPDPRAAEESTARYFESIKNRPLLLAAFLREMPKGADLHNHLSGAIYAESFIEWAVESGYCIDTAQLAIVPCGGAGTVPAAQAHQNPVLNRRLIDAFSMRNWELSEQSGHDHFFDTFGKFGYATVGHLDDMLVEAIVRAERDNLIYLELMLTPDDGRSSQLGRKLGWKEDFGAMRNALLAAGFRDSLRLAMPMMDAVEASARAQMGCGGLDTSAACRVAVRYLWQVGRGGAPEQVFAQILAGFEMAEIDPRFVGFNLVQPEDYFVPLRDFSLQMRMIDYLRPLYKKAHVTLHAGELAPGLVPPEELCCHIRESVELGHAERIGHGVDVAYEENPFELLGTMAKRNVMVEICLTSNDVILGVRGARHPLPLYIGHGVPVALATDDEGVSRIDMTNEYIKAVLEQGVSYRDLKTMARNSLEHSFLPGKSIWADAKAFTMTGECAEAIRLASQNVMPQICKTFLDANEKARMQWRLESAFRTFETAEAAAKH